jgi:phage gpG-like protein
MQERLTGRGPFPVAEHRLGERTGQLRLRTYSTEATIVTEGDQVRVTGAIGSPVFYAAIHEFGGKRAPERAPFRTGIRENMQYIADKISEEIATSLPA